MAFAEYLAGYFACIVSEFNNRERILKRRRLNNEPEGNSVYHMSVLAAGGQAQLLI